MPKRKSRTEPVQDDPDSRAALLIRCTKAEATAIREATQAERRTISGFILNLVQNHVDTQERVRQRMQAIQARRDRVRRADTQTQAQAASTN